MATDPREGSPVVSEWADLRGRRTEPAVAATDELWRYQGWLRFARPDQVTLSVNHHPQEFYECRRCGALISDAMRQAHQGVHSAD